MYIYRQQAMYRNKSIKAQVQQSTSMTPNGCLLLVWWLTSWSMGDWLLVKVVWDGFEISFHGQQGTAPIASGSSISLIEVNLHRGCSTLAHPSRWVEGVDRQCKDDELLLYILIPSCWLSWDSDFFTRNAVRRAPPLAYQHSLMIFAITRRACGQEDIDAITDLIAKLHTSITFLLHPHSLPYKHFSGNIFLLLPIS